ncbi:hypothetical protein [Coleofasciculus sp. G1-WW12-02]|uniref:hypothetical protein n=1 Tax=Coleofasciculus sp. G1-WW12-02 TaxID=3068483 RepID=UPI0040636588
MKPAPTRIAPHTVKSLGIVLVYIVRVSGWSDAIAGFLFIRHLSQGRPDKIEWMGGVH